MIPKAEIPEDFREYIDTEYSESPPELVYPELIGHKIMGQAVKELKKKGLEKIKTDVLKGDPARKIVDFAETNEIDMIFLGSCGVGSFKGVVLGSVANKVCHLAKSACVTVK